MFSRNDGYGTGTTVEKYTPLAQAVLTPKEGRFIKLHEFLAYARRPGAKPADVKMALTGAWNYANHHNLQELVFVIALAKLFVDTHPGQPLPFEIPD